VAVATVAGGTAELGRTTYVAKLFARGKASKPGFGLATLEQKIAIFLNF